MRGFNRVFIAGYLGSDPELLHSRGGSTYARLRVATTRSWLSGDASEVEEKTEWHRVVVWGRQAEICARHLRVGSALTVEGHLSSYRATSASPAAALTGTETGAPIFVSIVAERIHFLPRDRDQLPLQEPDAAPATLDKIAEAAK